MDSNLIDAPVTTAASRRSDNVVLLMERARGGSAAAVGSLFESARAYLLFLAHKQLPVAVRAKVGPSDIVQETAYDMHRDFARFDGTTAEEFFAWLRSILQNNVKDAVRKYEMSQKRAVAKEAHLTVVVDRQGARVLPVDEHLPDQSAIRREDAAAVAGIVSGLPADYRTVLRMRYWDGLSFPEIASQIGRSEEAVRKLWFRAVRRLQSQIRGQF